VVDLICLYDVVVVALSCVIAYALSSEGGCSMSSQIMTLAKGVVALLFLKRRGL